MYNVCVSSAFRECVIEYDSLFKLMKYFRYFLTNARKFKRPLSSLQLVSRRSLGLEDDGKLFVN